MSTAIIGALREITEGDVFIIGSTKGVRMQKSFTGPSCTNWNEFVLYTNQSVCILINLYATMHDTLCCLDIITVLFVANVRYNFILTFNTDNAMSIL